MSGAARRQRPPCAERGAALIAAVLIAAIVAAIAVMLTTRDQYAILGVSRLQEQTLATALTRELEVQAVTLLGQDLETSRHDDASEAWARTPLEAERGDFTAIGTLADAQRLFNLNALAFQPPTAAADGSPDGDVPPPVDDGSGGETGADDGTATRALFEVSTELRDLAPPRPDAPPGTPGQPPAPDAQPPAPDGQPPAADTTTLSPQQVAVARFTLLLQALQLPPELVPAVLDWLDADSDTRFPNGAEDEYYSRLDTPYRTANAPFADVSELRLVRGITPGIYAKLAPHVTVLGNSVPINVNTAPPEVLMSLGPGIDRATADLLVSSREIQPWPNLAAFMRHPLLGGRPLLAEGLATQTRWFELRTRVEGADGDVFRRSLLERAGPNQLRIARRERRYHDG